MSMNELHSRKSRYSDKQYQNSSVCNHSIKSQLNNLSIDLPHNRKKYTTLQRQIIRKQHNGAVTTINLTNTKYPILTEVSSSQELRWKIQNFGETKQWSIKWMDTGVTQDILQKMNYLQRINHFPLMSLIARKNTLATTLAKMKQQFPKDYDYYPRTFLFPQEHSKIRHYFVQSRKRGLLKTFIVKPQAGCQGRGIYLTQNPADLQKQQRCVIQKYISNPLLYNGLKFDLRIYVLIACIQPLRIYLYNEGLVRFATQIYELPDESNIDNYFMHLTNYAINKSHPSYEYNQSVKDLSYGHKKSLAQFFRSLKQMGYRANTYWSQIKDNIIKTIIAAQPSLLANYRSARPLQPTYNMCFQLLGFDFMIDNQDRCFLLEVNHTPSFTADTPLDHIIKKNLIRDTLLMMQVTQKEVDARDDLERMRQREKYVKFKHGNDNTVQEKEILIGQLNEIRVAQQMANRGTYECIYPSKHPTKQQSYQLFLSHAARQFQTNTGSSTSFSSANIRSKIIQVPKSTMPTKQILTKIASENRQSSNNPKNIIYNYGQIKHNQQTSKRTLQTLPSEPVESRTSKKGSSGKSSRYNSSPKLKTQKSVNREGPSKPQLKQLHRSQQRRPAHYYQQLLKPPKQSIKVSSDQKQHGTKQLSSFTKRIRAYKTPLMF